MTHGPFSPKPPEASHPQAKIKLSNTTVYLLVISILGVMSGLVIDLFFFNFVGNDSPPHYVGRFYGQPYWGGAYPIKTFLAVLSTICFAVAMIRFKPTTESQRLQERMTLHAQSQDVPVVSGSEMIDHNNTLTMGKELVIWGVFLLSGIFSAIFLLSPWTFFVLAKEDGIIEMLSALMWFLAFGVFIHIFQLLRRAKVKPRLLYLLPTAGLAFVCFLIGMEEMSWFQRIFAFETPEAFSGNTQGELNLHNFYSGPFDHAYYFSAFLFLILLPFVQEKTELLKKFRYLEFFVPSRFIVMTSAILVAYNYYGWNFQLIQVSFFITLFILAYSLWAPRSQGHPRLLLGILLLGLIVTQALFLTHDHHLIIFWENYYEWDLAEYKEFFIPLSFLVYSLEVWQKVRIRLLSPALSASSQLPA